MMASQQLGGVLARHDRAPGLRVVVATFLGTLPVFFAMLIILRHPAALSAGSYRQEGSARAGDEAVDGKATQELRSMRKALEQLQQDVYRSKDSGESADKFGDMQKSLNTLHDSLKVVQDSLSTVSSSVQQAAQPAVLTVPTALHSHQGIPAGVFPARLPVGRRIVSEEAHASLPSELSARHKDFQRFLSKELSSWLAAASKVSPYHQCSPGSWQLELSMEQTRTFINLEAAEKGTILQGNALSVPCEAYGCCDVVGHVRPGTHDFDVFLQVFQEHFLRFLYPVTQKLQPKYILDAGANVGFAAMLFKLLWPEATVVSLEPDTKNYAVLRKNVERFPGVHALNAGFWGRRTKIALLTDSSGSWGNVFKEVPLNEEGVDAYGVQDLEKMFNITAFDLVKIDVEGAEGPAFADSMDTSWIDRTKVVLLELHDFFASHFGLKPEELGANVAGAFARTKTAFHSAEDGEHVFLFREDIKTELLKAAKFGTWR